MVPYDSTGTMTGRDAAEKRINQINQGIGITDLMNGNSSLGIPVIGNLVGGQNRVPNRKRYLRYSQY